MLIPKMDTDMLEEICNEYESVIVPLIEKFQLSPCELAVVSMVFNARWLVNDQLSKLEGDPDNGEESNRL